MYSALHVQLMGDWVVVQKVMQYVRQWNADSFKNYSRVEFTPTYNTL